ncbi:MAG: hypothetical protein KF688_15720 [Pirellulales bacterium]|nr:hypothetical protein [Pirellulales bacterium]
MNTGQFLYQDHDADVDFNYGEYYSPFLAPGTFTHAGADYGIEFRVRPVDDLPFLNPAWANLYLTWSDNVYNYNISIDRDGNDGSAPEPNGDIVYGRGSFTPAISNIDWSTPHTIFIGHRGDGTTSVFDFYIDGVIQSTRIDGSIARSLSGFELFQDSIGFGDGTTASINVRAEWYFVRVWDVSNPALIAGATANFNGDEGVDGSDFMIWQRNFGRNDAGVSVATGDANNDGMVDGDDLDVWRTQFGSAPIVAAISSVPEPSSWISISGVIVVMARIRNRIRRPALRRA